MSLGMHFFKVPETLLISKGYTSPRVDDTDFLGTIIGTEEVGYLNSAWGIHIWLMNNGETLHKRGDPFRLSEPVLRNLKAMLEQAAADGEITATGAEPDPNNLVLRYKNAWKSENPEGLRQHFPYKFDNITPGDVMEGLKVVNDILEDTDFSKNQIWYYPFY
ncbi:hypothetical protein [Faecalibaculum rodentium]|uniref:Uncharacterized protein n=3 Tax=Faecalibaculum rodentium TaxID=1702221 RepID=A0A140DTQ2_9FIRM|nr:hypothetical protein [Faecalibaculum rodentium]AMK54029.1 hypothetical protein AALO17_08950 [Faecalibaculum rodentium]